MRMIVMAVLTMIILSSIIPHTDFLFTRGGDVIMHRHRDPTNPNFPLWYEYEAALWIKKNTPRSTIIISDPVTMDLLSALSDRIPLAHIFMGRPVRPQDKEGVNIVLKLLKSEKDIDVYNYLTKIGQIGVSGGEFYRSFEPLKNMSFIIVITPRTVKWLESNGRQPIVYLSQDEHKISGNIISVFAESDLFEKIFNLDNVLYIFRPRYTQILPAVDFLGNTGDIYEEHLTLYLPLNEGKGEIAYSKSLNRKFGKIINPLWIKSDKDEYNLKFDGCKTHINCY
jgi:hypothetical protein